MEQARFNEDTETQAKLARYFESYGERYLGRTAENDALFDSFGGQRARDAVSTCPPPPWLQRPLPILSPAMRSG